MGLLQRILAWSSLEDYEAAKEQASIDVVARFSRGNVSVQNGQVMDDRELKVLSKRGDAAVASLDRLRTKA
jgi:hypothetical protein